MMSYDGSMDGEATLRDLMEVVEKLRQQFDLLRGYGGDLETLDKVEDLINGIKDSMSSFTVFGRRFDLRPDVNANGYWTFIQVIGRMLHRIHGELIGGKNITSRSLMAMEVVVQCQKFGLKLGNESGHLFHQSSYIIVESRDAYKEVEPLMFAIHGHYSGFFLTETSARAFKSIAMIFLAAHHMFNPVTIVRCLMDEDTKGQMLTQYFSQSTVASFKRIMSIFSNNFLNRLLSNVFYYSRPQIARDIFVPRQFAWTVTKDGKIICKSADTSGKAVRCRLIRDNCKDKSPNRSVIVHCHGGGFLSMSPDAHEVYLRYWSLHVSNVPIVSVDYSLSPAVKFPVALQETLDVYLWLTSGNSAVADIIGFQPERIIVCGDSAGGNLVTSLCLVLNDIRKSGQSGIVMPHAIVAFYPVTRLDTAMSPSRMLLAMDPILTVGMVFDLLCAYLIPDDRRPSKTFVDLTEDEIITIVDEVSRSQNPYVSPLLYEDFESLADVTLNVVTSHCDPLLDDAICLVQKWKGPVTLDLMDGLTHGFLHLLYLCKEAKMGNVTGVKRMTDAIHANRAKVTTNFPT